MGGVARGMVYVGLVKRPSLFLFPSNFVLFLFKDRGVHDLDRLHHSPFVIETFN